MRESENLRGNNSINSMSGSANRRSSSGRTSTGSARRPAGSATGSTPRSTGTRTASGVPSGTRRPSGSSQQVRTASGRPAGTARRTGEAVQAGRSAESRMTGNRTTDGRTSGAVRRPAGSPQQMRTSSGRTSSETARRTTEAGAIYTGRNTSGRPAGSRNAQERPAGATRRPAGSSQQMRTGSGRTSGGSHSRSGNVRRRSKKTSIWANKIFLTGVIGSLAALFVIIFLVFYTNNGFKTDKDGTYYVKHGKKVVADWIEVDGKKYFASEKGYILYGLTTINGETYFFDKEGVMQSGFINTDRDYIRYFDKDGKMLKGLKKLEGDEYYFGNDGVMTYDWQIIDGVSYLFGRDGKRLVGLCYDLNGDAYYLKPEGGYLTGRQEINGDTYVFGDDGKAATGFATDETGNTYYVDRTGKIAKGSVCVDGSWYLFSADFVMLKNGWQEYDGNKYYADADGKLSVDTIAEIEGKKYRFASDGKLASNVVEKPAGSTDENGAAYTNTTFIYEDKMYFADSTGALVSGWFNYLDGTKGYAGADNVISVGQIQVDGKDYYFDNYGVAKAGFITDDKGTKCVSVDGELYTNGFHVIDGIQYKFDKDGYLQTGWIELEDGQQGYALATGEILYNSSTIIDGKPYYFGYTGHLTSEGWVNWRGYRSYVCEDGSLKTGVQTVDGKPFYFDNNGVMGMGWITAEDGSEYYADENGYLVTGSIEVAFNKCEFGADYKLVSKTSIYDKMVALTYDDGPSVNTPKILDAMEQTGARCTFFWVGDRISSYTESVVRADALGCEVGSHTYEHVYLTDLSADGIASQINKTDDAVANVIGKTCPVLRPPGGFVNSTVSQYINKPIYLWSIDTRDWATRDTASTYSVATTDIGDGDIILMHDLYESTANAAYDIITTLQSQGFACVTVSELAEAKGGAVNGKQYYSFR